MNALSARILTIEDDPALAANLRASLEREGYLVTLKDTGQAGIDHVRAIRHVFQEPIRNGKRGRPP
jgi:DNA-binding response OmpR family regulator